jgi:hypothetical protein
VAAYGQATVSEVLRALDQRQKLIAFAQDAQALAPADLQRVFLERFGG